MIEVHLKWDKNFAGPALFSDVPTSLFSSSSECKSAAAAAAARTSLLATKSAKRAPSDELREAAAAERHHYHHLRTPRIKHARQSSSRFTFANVLLLARHSLSPNVWQQARYSANAWLPARYSGCRAGDTELLTRESAAAGQTFAECLAAGAIFSECLVSS